MQPRPTTRREILGTAAGVASAIAVGCETTPTVPRGGEIGVAAAIPGGSSTAVAMPASTPGSGARKLGKTGRDVEAVSLGGEGVLRTHGKRDEAVPVILEALKLGVRYCDTAPAYASSQDYYGEAFASMPGARDKVTLATKTHERDRDGALRLLDDSLRRLKTDHVDIWQLHDLRDMSELDEIFGPGGAIEAVEAARADGRVRHVGITGHHDPAILVEAMRRYDFDTVLVAMNPADPRRLPFLSTVVPEARRRNIGVIGMKVLAAGRLTEEKAASPDELIRYAMRHADTVIIGCGSTSEVRDNLASGRSGAMLSDAEAAALEARIAPRASRYDTFKRA
jgi:predicted aldo/keto reductase-like oxidoreductase